MMIASERFLRIVNTVNERGFISTKELSENLDVTETTIRRDCEELEKQGLLISCLLYTSHHKVVAAP